MNVSDLFRFAFQSLTQHKLRSALTLLGVILGAFLVIITISIGQGVQEVIPRLMRGNDRLRQIELYQTWGRDNSDVPEEPVPGEMSDERRARLKEAKKQRAANSGEVTRVHNDERLAEFAAIEHVESVVPTISYGGELWLGDKSAHASFRSTTTDDRSFPRALVAGRPIASNGAAEVLIHELLAYDLGFQDEADVAKLLGATVRIEETIGGFHLGSSLEYSSDGKLKLTADEKRKLDDVIRSLPVVAEQLNLPDDLQQLLKKAFTTPAESPPNLMLKPKLISTGNLIVVGIYRSSTEEEHQNLYEYFGHHDNVMLPVDVARAFFRQTPNFEKQGYHHVVIRVDEERHVRSVVEHLRSQKYSFHSLVEIVEHLQRQYGLMLWSMTALGTVALLISALGITNTMLMSVLERTREIGIMKAVGARDGQIQAIFLTEGVFVGLVGAAVALVSAWGASKFANSWIQQIVAKEANQLVVDDQLFLFPWWLVVGIFVVTLAVTLTAAWLPARRAARIPPVIALRHD
ncbi:MAG: FtsX-like permease family protein [Planctomycetaceae bacterium]|nr:FtsX-like permease family protein [Planctomycetaceae bacterium]